jgi:hypothetical protein
VDLLQSSDGGGGDVMDLIMGDPPSGPLGLDLGARVLVGLPCSSTWIRVVKCGSNRHGDNSMGMGKISIASYLSSSSLDPPCPLPWLDDEDHRCHAATGLGHEPQLWTTHGGVWRPVYEVARSEGSIGQLASGSREGDSGHSKTLTLGLGVFVENVGGSLKARPWGPL